MATPAQRTNTWTLDELYDQNVAGTTGGYNFGGAMWIQGSNNVGRLLNQPSSLKISSPTQVSSDSTWDVSKLVQAGQYSLAIKTD